MSLIQHISRNSDVFCFADYPHRSVSIGLLKDIPEADNKDLNTWYFILLFSLNTTRKLFIFFFIV